METSPSKSGSRLFTFSCLLYAAAWLGALSPAHAQVTSPFERTLSGPAGTWQFFPIEIPAGTAAFNVQISGGTGDADLYVRAGQQPTEEQFDCRPWIDGNAEMCDLPKPQAGTFYIGVFAFAEFADLKLTATWSGAATPSQPDATGLADWQKQQLDEHNLLRAKHCAPALSWNAELAASAQAWADACQFEHSQSGGAYGENLSAGTNQTAIGAVDSWYGEIKDYNFAAPGFSMGTGHFTQVVWKGSTQLGCGMARCGNIFPDFGGAFFYVCRYAPPGNMTGEYEKNVVPLSDGGTCE